MSRKNENKCNYITNYKSNNMVSNKYKNTKNNIVINIKAIGYTACIAILASSSWPSLRKSAGIRVLILTHLNTLPSIIPCQDNMLPS